MKRKTRCPRCGRLIAVTLSGKLHAHNKGVMDPALRRLVVAQKCSGSNLEVLSDLNYRKSP